MKIADRLRREIDNFGPCKQDGCDDVLSVAAVTLDSLEAALQFALEQLLAYEQAATGELFNSVKINDALALAAREI